MPAPPTPTLIFEIDLISILQNKPISAFKALRLIFLYHACSLLEEMEYD